MIENSENKKDAAENKAFWRIINFLNLGLIFIISYFFIAMQTMGMIASDTGLHLSYMMQYLEGKLYIPHPLWHLGTHHLSLLLHIDYSVGAAIFTALLITIYAIIIYKVAKSLDEYRGNEAKWYLITMIALTIGPFFWVNYYSRIYMGPGSPSIWHNVTLITVQPLALLSVFYTIRFFLTNKSSYFILAVLVSLISIFAKPNYIIVFLPSIVIYALLKKYFDKRRMIFVAVTILLSVAALAYQFINQYESNGGKSTGGSIIVDCFGVWSHYTPSVTVSIMMALGLPFLISLFNYRSVKQNEYIKFTWLLVLFSTILFACFAESGERYIDGNFSWSWMISLSLIYIFTIIEYFKQYYTMPPLVRYPLLTMMLYQVYVGWYFVIGMFNGVNFTRSVDNFPLFVW